MLAVRRAVRVHPAQRTRTAGETQQRFTAILRQLVPNKRRRCHERRRYGVVFESSQKRASRHGTAKPDDPFVERVTMSTRV